MWMGVFMGVLPTCVYLYIYVPSAHRSKEGIESPELELQVLVSHRVGAENRTQVFSRAAIARAILPPLFLESGCLYAENSLRRAGCPQTKRCLSLLPRRGRGTKGYSTACFVNSES